MSHEDERSQELEDALDSTREELRRSEQRAGEAEAMQREYEGRFDTARVHLWNARSALVNGASAKDVIAQIGTHLKDIESDRFRATPPRAGEEEPPATRIVEAARALYENIADDENDDADEYWGLVTDLGIALAAAPPARRVDGAGEREEALLGLIEHLAGIVADEWGEEHGAVLRARSVLAALAPAAQRAPAGAGPGDDAGGGTP